MKVNKTQRGFQYLDLKDSENMKWNLRQSSAIDSSPRGFAYPGSSYIYLQEITLDREKLRELIPQLMHWLDTGSFLESTEEENPFFPDIPDEHPVVRAWDKGGDKIVGYFTPGPYTRISVAAKAMCHYDLDENSEAVNPINWKVAWLRPIAFHGEEDVSVIEVDDPTSPINEGSFLATYYLYPQEHAGGK